MSDFSSGTSDFENLKESSFIQDPTGLVGAATDVDKDKPVLDIPQVIMAPEEISQKAKSAGKSADTELPQSNKKSVKVFG